MPWYKLQHCRSNCIRASSSALPADVSRLLLMLLPILGTTEKETHHVTSVKDACTGCARQGYGSSEGHEHDLADSCMSVVHAHTTASRSMSV